MARNCTHNCTFPPQLPPDHKAFWELQIQLFRLSAGSPIHGATQNLEHMDKLVLWTHHWRARCASTSSDGCLNAQKLMADSYTATSYWASTTRANDFQSSTS